MKTYGATYTARLVFQMKEVICVTLPYQWHIDLHLTNDIPPVKQLLMHTPGPRFAVFRWRLPIAGSDIMSQCSAPLATISDSKASSSLIGKIAVSSGNRSPYLSDFCWRIRWRLFSISRSLFKRLEMMSTSFSWWWRYSLSDGDSGDSGDESDRSSASPPVETGSNRPATRRRQMFT